jgi:hypothetical protein
MSIAVPPYAGGSQTSRINIASLAPKTEDGPKAINPYAAIPPQKDWLPPPIYKTDLWGAMQTWPL